MDSTRTEPTTDPISLPAYQPGHHWVSHFNFAAQVRQGLAFPDPLLIFDSTIKKILYTSGLRPSVDDLLYIAEALEEAGIRELFLSVHWWGDTTPDRLQFEVCRAILGRGFAFRTTVSTDSGRTASGDGSNQAGYARQAIDMLREIGMTNMWVSVGDPGEEMARARQLEQLAEVFSYAQSLGISCTLSISDVGRRDFDYVLRQANEGVRLGAVCISLGDSYSALSPEGMKLLVGQFKAHVPTRVPITVHVHNDFGLGSAAAVAAATAGAHPDVAVNGISYRSGFAALEEVVLSLELLYGVHTGVKLDRLQRLSDIVARRIGLPTHPLKPITGSHQFLRDRPTWVLQYLKGGPEAFPPNASCYAPSVVGSRMRVVWGNQLANPVIQAKLRQIGLAATKEQLLEIRTRIEQSVQALIRYPFWLSEEQVESICRDVVG